MQTKEVVSAWIGTGTASGLLAAWDPGVPGAGTVGLPCQTLQTSGADPAKPGKKEAAREVPGGDLDLHLRFNVSGQSKP